MNTEVVPGPLGTRSRTRTRHQAEVVLDLVPPRKGGPGPDRRGAPDEIHHRPMAWTGQWPPALCLGCGSILHPTRTNGFHVNCRPDPWCADRLWRMGADMSQHLVSTPARLETCRTCGAAVYAALDSGLVAVVDPLPITGGAHSEFVWRYAGRATFDLIPRANRKELVYRDQVRIRTRRFPVHGEHACKAAGKTCISYDPTDYRARMGKLLTPASRNPLPDEPPF